MGLSYLVWIGCVFLSKYLKYGIFILFDLLDKIGLKIVPTLPDYVWKDTTWFKKKNKQNFPRVSLCCGKFTVSRAREELTGWKSDVSMSVWQWGFVSV